MFSFFDILIKCMIHPSPSPYFFLRQRGNKKKEKKKKKKKKKGKTEKKKGCFLFFLDAYHRTAANKKKKKKNGICNEGVGISILFLGTFSGDIFFSQAIRFSNLNEVVYFVCFYFMVFSTFSATQK